MKTFWKLLGAAALAAGFTPYRVEKNDETGETKYQALLWYGSRNTRGEEKNFDIHLGFKKPEEEEPHLFSDELCVEYTGASAEEPAGPVEEAPAEESEAPAAEESAEEAPAEEAPAEAAPAEENKDEA